MAYGADMSHGIGAGHPLPLVGGVPSCGVRDEPAIRSIRQCLRPVPCRGVRMAEGRLFERVVIVPALEVLLRDRCVSIINGDHVAGKQRRIDPSQQRQCRRG